MVAFFGMELTGSDDFGQLLHVGRLNVHNVKGLISDLHMPEIDPKIVCRQISLAIRID